MRPWNVKRIEKELRYILTPYDYHLCYDDEKRKFVLGVIGTEDEYYDDPAVTLFYGRSIQETIVAFHAWEKAGGKWSQLADKVLHTSEQRKKVKARAVELYAERGFNPKAALSAMSHIDPPQSARAARWWAIKMYIEKLERLADVSGPRSRKLRRVS